MLMRHNYIGTPLWIILFMQLLIEATVSVHDLSDFGILWVYLVLLGSTPTGAFPAVYHFGLAKKPWADWKADSFTLF